MTISNQNASVTIAGNSSQTSFTFTFEIPYQSDGVTPAIDVYTIISSVRTLLTITTDYTVTGIGNAGGGVVTYPVSGSPLATGAFLEIDRALDYNQPYEFLNQAFLPSQIETLADYLEMQIQQLAARVSALES